MSEIKTEMRPVKPYKTLVTEMDEYQLNWAVAQALGKPIYKARKRAWLTKPLGKFDQSHKMPYWIPCTDWAQGGPIIEREGIDLASPSPIAPEWCAMFWRLSNKQSGPTPLIAAMRCYVASKLGNDISIPPELI